MNSFTGAAEKDVQRAATILREGGLIAIPTETYYGLAVDPFNEKALERLYAVKGRPSVKPVLVLISSVRDITRLTDTVPAAAHQLIKKYWPGPLTIVLPARAELSVLLTGGTGTVGVRLSPHPVACALLDAWGGPLTATSANRSGGAAAVSDEEVRKTFGQEVDLILHGGRTPGRKPSTLVGFEGGRPVCIRNGCIACDEIFQLVQSADR